ncbi:MAG: SOS response-associated peptidase family protein [Xanthobacteraceae bacterium]
MVEATQGTTAGDIQCSRETMTAEPFFREPLKSKRCLVPVSGYYEWHRRSTRMPLRSSFTAQIASLRPCPMFLPN